ncbi:hypothetical protein [Capnocytophaga canimorsus]|nr:hypothetical protein [Capnocytophaga canimorsus]
MKSPKIGLGVDWGRLVELSNMELASQQIGRVIQIIENYGYSRE